MSRCPSFEVFPSLCLPPVECCLGTRPSQAAKSRPRRNCSIGGAKVSTASAVIGPTPGIVCSWRGISASFDSAAIRAFRALIRSVRWAICSRSIRQMSRASSGISVFEASTTFARRGT